MSLKYALIVLLIFLSSYGWAQPITASKETTYTIDLENTVSAAKNETVDGSG